MSCAHHLQQSVQVALQPQWIITTASLCCSKKVRKLHLFLTKVVGSCIYEHIWLRKTWQKLLSFARTWPKAKIFRTSTSNSVQVLSYLQGYQVVLSKKGQINLKKAKWHRKKPNAW